MLKRRLLNLAGKISGRTAASFHYHETDAKSALSHYGSSISEIEQACGKLKRTDLKNAINHALDETFERDPSAITFGEDLGFGGVFRVTGKGGKDSVDLQQKYWI